MKQRITREAFWELLNGLIEDKEESEIAKLEKQLLEKYEVIEE